MNKLADFTQNQVEFFHRVKESWLNVAEGGKRGGKNILLTLAFCKELEEHQDKIHLVAGVSQSTARLNVIDSNGLGMKNYFEGRCHEGKYEGRNCLFVQTKNGEKVVLIAGGAKANDPAYIKGFSIGMAYITEANECHPNFLQECMDRCLASSNMKIFHDLNPKEPTHWYYEDILNSHEDKQSIDSNYGYNFGHFTILDNMSIDNNKLKTILSRYNKDSVWYKRDILGLRTVAEGLIYHLFANNHNDYVIDQLPKNLKGFIQIGVDFGGNKSGQAFVATLISKQFDHIYIIKDYWNNDQMDTEKLQSEFVKFVKSIQREFYMYHIATVRADSAEQVLKNSLQSALINNKIKLTVQNSIKKPILDRIRLYNKLIACNRFKILRSCKHTIQALDYAIWNNKKLEDQRLDDGTSNIDNLDAMEYSTEEWHSQIETVIDYVR